MARRQYRVNADPVTVLEDILSVPDTDFNDGASLLLGRVVGPKHFPSCGKMPAPYGEAFLSARQASRIEYVVYSYGTPIAYRMYSGKCENPVYGSNGRLVGWSDYVWVIPNVVYSNTTSKHQHKVRTALSLISTSVKEG